MLFRSVAAVSQARLSASPSSANVAASIAPDVSTLSRNGLIAAANEAMRVQRSLEHEVAALQQTMLSMRNQSIPLLERVERSGAILAATLALLGLADSLA